MQKYLCALMEKTDIPPEGQTAFLAADAVIAPRREELQMLLTKHFDGLCTGQEVAWELDALAEKTGQNACTLHGLYCLYAAAPYHQRCRAAGYDEAVYEGTLTDCRCKIAECFATRQVWGISVPLQWYDDFYRLQRFALGRMQYNREAFLYPHFEAHGYAVNTGDKVFNMHIPSAGPLTRERRYDSYKRAYAFFKDELHDGVMPFVCYSWLLYPNNRLAIPSAHNVCDFMNDFTILNTVDDPKFSFASRIFNVSYTGSTKDLPRETSMQREMVAWLDGGNAVGRAYGIFFYDGESFFR